MKRDNFVYIYHIRDSLNRILDYTKDIQRKEFFSSTIIQDAVIRNIEIIGEAANGVSKEFKDANTQIEWKQIIGMRNKLIYEYFGIRIEIVWETIKQDIPLLKTQIEQLISNKSSQ